MEFTCKFKALLLFLVLVTGEEGGEDPPLTTLVEKFMTGYQDLSSALLHFHQYRWPAVVHLDPSLSSKMHRTRGNKSSRHLQRLTLKQTQYQILGTRCFGNLASFI